MKSVTIKGEDGQKLIKVYHNGKGEYFVERCSSVAHIVCVITLDNRERITIPTRPKGEGL
jgi:hypothetical protein